MLATSFRRTLGHLIAPAGSSLSEGELAARVPSIFAGEAHGSRSSRYTHIPTIELVRKLQGEGWSPTFAVQAKPRDEDRTGHAKHMLRFRHASASMQASEVPEVILVNSHDGSTSYQMLAGYFRFVCANGLVVGDGALEVRVPHRGDVIDGVLSGAASMLRHFDETAGRVDELKSIQLRPVEQLAFARAAKSLRWDDGQDVAPEALNRPRRHSDTGADLWATFNRVQENLVRGGIQVRTEGDRSRRCRLARSVNGIAENVRLNQALWTLAEEMKNLRAAA